MFKRRNQPPEKVKPSPTRCYPPFFNGTGFLYLLLPMSSLLNTVQLERRYHSRQVVEPFDLQLRAGDILGLLGPNGAGKSTIMRMLCGDLAPSAGSVTICGEDLQRRPIQAKALLGFLPERPPLLPDQTVDEYLADSARLRRLGRRQRQKARKRVKQLCGLDQVGHRLIRKLSKGYQQRTGLAQAIIHEPRLVILDEPTDGLDPSQIRQVRDLVLSLADGCGVIISSHILSEIQTTCNRVAILQQGRIVYEGDLNVAEETSYRVGLEQSPDESLVAALTPVAAAQQLHTDCYRISLHPGYRASDLSRQILEQGWGLTELTPEQVSLEQRYFKATTGAGR
jgi:ABC-2 type transport system ATP-binding protein